MCGLSVAPLGAGDSYDATGEPRRAAKLMLSHQYVTGSAGSFVGRDA